MTARASPTAVVRGWHSGRCLRRPVVVRESSLAVPAGCGPRTFPSLCLRLFEPQYSHASAYPAAEAISDEGRPQRRSVMNRRPFDCFKSAEGIRFSAGARTAPRSFHRGTFWLHLLGDKRWKHYKSICDSKNRAGRSLAARRPATAFASLRSPQSAARELSHYDVCGSSEPRSSQPPAAEARSRSRKLTRALRRLPPEHLRRAAALSSAARAKRDPRSRRR